MAVGISGSYSRRMSTAPVRTGEKRVLLPLAVCAAGLTVAMLVLLICKTRPSEIRGYQGAGPGGKTEIRNIVKMASAQHRVAPELVWAVISVESNFNTKAKSHKGAMGLMQIMPDTAKFLDIDDPYDTRQNIAGGTRYLSELLVQFNGNHEKAIAAYNAGPGAVKKYGGIPPYRETRNYVSKVMKIYRKELAKRESYLS